MRRFRHKIRPFSKSSVHPYIRWMGKAGKAVGSVCRDIKSLWCWEPPIPAGVRVILTVILLMVMIVPMLYCLVPPTFTFFSVYYLINQEFPQLPTVPHLPTAVTRNITGTYRDLIKKITFRTSMLVNLYDYIQTARAFGFSIL